MDADTTDLDDQIAALLAEKAERKAKAEREAQKRAKEERNILIASTPTKKKDNRFDESALTNIPAQPQFQAKATMDANKSSNAKVQPVKQELPSLPSAASRMSSALAGLRTQSSTRSDHLAEKPIVPRSSSFADRPLPKPSSSQTTSVQPGPSGSSHLQRPIQRDPATSSKGKARVSEPSPELEIDEPSVLRDKETLEIIENLQPGPRIFGKDPEGEDSWNFIEPNSGIRLSKRILPHANLQHHLSGRYYLSPGQIYSVIRQTKDGATFDIPVEGDFVTIAVVAERGEIRVSGTKEVGSDDDDDGLDDDDENEDGDGEDGKVKKKQKPLIPKSTGPGKPEWENKYKKNEKNKQARRAPRKYINLKLCSMPPRTPGASGSTAGDAILQLLLFESDAIIRGEKKDENGNIEKTYKGGSGGAYEKWCNLGVGSVIALLNPRVLRPLRAGAGSPHPLTLPLALNPMNADGITVIGQARDLGCCAAQQKDGNRCKTWVDLRQGQVCEYHIHQAVSRSRSSRAEFSSATTPFALSAEKNGSSSGGKGGWNNSRFGNKSGGAQSNVGAQAAPRGSDNGGGGATYLIGGSTINTGREYDNGSSGLRKFGDEHLHEKLGRSRAEKRKRRLEEKETEEVLKRLIDGRSTGGKYLKAIEAIGGGGAGSHKNKKKLIGMDGMDGMGRGQDRDGEEGEEDKVRTFSASMIQKIGFDPHKLGMSAEEKEKRSRSIQLLKMEGKGFDRKAVVKRQNVRAPAVVDDQKSGRQVEEGDAGMVDLD